MGSRGVGRWSLARQLVVLQVALVVLALGVATVLAGVDADRQIEEQAGRRCLAVATTLAAAPDVAAALASADPSALLQPTAVRVQQETGVDFVTILRLDGIRLTHRDPAQIGQPFLGTISPGLAGRSLVETYTGTLGESIRAVVPIRATPDGPVLALVSVGVTLDGIGTETEGRIWALVAGAVAVLAVALMGTWLIGRRVDRVTHRLGPDELGVMYEHHEAVLHSVREGLMLLDPGATVRLANGEAVRLLDLPSAVEGRAVTDIGLPAELATALSRGEDLRDQVFPVNDRVIVVNSGPTRGRIDGSRSLGRVVTLRDHTELTALTDELGVAHNLTEALKSQAHESANRMHAMVGLIELGRPQEAVEFATSELALAQAFTDRVVSAVHDPVVAAVLLAKAQSAAERGIDLVLTPDCDLDEDLLADAGVPARDVVTLLGNLVDNAVQAMAGTGGPGKVEVTVRRVSSDSDQLLIRVADNGPGFSDAVAAQMFSRGFSTKSEDGALHGHGLGLALVAQVIHRHHGSTRTSGSAGGVFEVVLGRASSPLPAAPDPVRSAR